MTNQHHLIAVARRRAALTTELWRIEQAHWLTVLDHISARIRCHCPEAAHVALAYDVPTQAVDLKGVLGAQSSPLGARPCLWDGSDEQHTVAKIAKSIEADIQSALMPHQSPVWAMMRRNSVSENHSWSLELPPPDRAARIAELVREYHPEATAVVVDGHCSGGRIIEIVEGTADDGTRSLTTRRRWASECDNVLRLLVSGIFAIPDLAHCHLTPLHDYRHPYGTSNELVRLMTLPPTA
ncbi:hypothetical protein ACFU99_19035 [Streptomyces sp. NPDC057654]|uniref:hypothetical protein n=1 Tax=Streptomyces sp. NPDC057654 TaxID=3346196 RepID=UPI0036C7E51D